MATQAVSSEQLELLQGLTPAQTLVPSALLLMTAESSSNLAGVGGILCLQCKIWKGYSLSIRMASPPVKPEVCP